MQIAVPAELQNTQNKSVLAYLRPLSCHGDIIEPIYAVVKKQPEVKFFCPDPRNFKYCFWYVDTSIFAFAQGMQHIGLLLPAALQSKAIASGALKTNDVAGDWFLFPYNHAELAKWLGSSLAFAKQ